MHRHRDHRPGVLQRSLPETLLCMVPLTNCHSRCKVYGNSSPRHVVRCCCCPHSKRDVVEHQHRYGKELTK